MSGGIRLTLLIRWGWIVVTLSAEELNVLLVNVRPLKVVFQ
jgi:hypothetical protein